MKLCRLALAAALALCPLAAEAASTVNPNVPANASALSSGPLRQNFASAFADINGIEGMFAGATSPTNPLVGQFWMKTSVVPATINVWDGAQWVQTATFNTSTHVWSVSLSSGSLVTTAPLGSSFSAGTYTVTLALDPNFAVTGGTSLGLAPAAAGSLLGNCTASSAEPAPCTWNAFANQAISAANNSIPYRTGGAWGSIPTGTSGASVARTDGANVWSLAQTVNQNAAALPAGQAGTALLLGAADGATTRAQIDAFAASPAVTLQRADGTNAGPSAVQAGDTLGSVESWGHNGGSYVGPGAAFRMDAREAWAAGNRGASVSLWTTPLATTTMAEVLRAGPDGGVTAPPAVTGGSKGSGTFNGLGFYVSGNAVAWSAVAPLTLNAATGAISVAANGVGAAQFRQSAALSVVGNPTAATANVADITCVGGAQFLATNAGGTALTCRALGATDMPVPTATTRGGVIATAPVTNNYVSGISLTDGSLLLSQVTFSQLGGTLLTSQMAALTGDVTNTVGTVATTIAPNAVTNAKLAQGAATTLKGNPTGVLANEQDVTLGATLTFSGTALQTVAHSGDVTSPVNSFALTIANAAVTNAKQANMNAWTIKMNNTSAAAAPQDVTVDGLTAKASPVSGDEIVIWDSVALAMKKATVGSISSAGSVASVGGLTGAVGLGVGLGTSGSSVVETSSPECGRLSRVSTTTVKFAPLGCETTRVAGAVFSIPAAGIACGTNTSTFVNGVGATTLVASTFYYVYEFSNAGVLTCDFRTDGNGHQPSSTTGNVGTEVRVSAGTTSDDSRTLIGMVFVNASLQFQDDSTCICVASWMHPGRSGKSGNAPLTTSTNITTTPAEITSSLRVQFLAWADETVAVHINTICSPANTTIADCRAFIDFDNGTPEDAGGYGQASATGQSAIPFAANMDKKGLTEAAVHFVTLWGSVNTVGTGTTPQFIGGASPATSPRTTVWMGTRN